MKNEKVSNKAKRLTLRSAKESDIPAIMKLVNKVNRTDRGLLLRVTKEDLKRWTSNGFSRLVLVDGVIVGHISADDYQIKRKALKIIEIRTAFILKEYRGGLDYNGKILHLSNILRYQLLSQIISNYPSNTLIVAHKLEKKYGGIGFKMLYAIGFKEIDPNDYEKLREKIKPKWIFLATTVRQIKHLFYRNNISSIYSYESYVSDWASISNPNIQLKPKVKGYN